MVTPMTTVALDVHQVKTIAIVALIALAIVIVLIGILVKAVVTKAVGIALILGLGLAVWHERSSLNECATKQDCTFFGYHLTGEK